MYHQNGGLDLEQNGQAIPGRTSIIPVLGLLVSFSTCRSSMWLLAVLLQLEDLFRNTAVQIKSLTELRKTIVMSLGQGLPNQSSRTIKALTKHIRSMGKFFRRMQQLSHQRFVLLPTCGDIILYLWSQVVEATSGPQELIGGKKLPKWDKVIIHFCQIPMRLPIHSFFLCKGWSYSKTTLRNGLKFERAAFIISIVCSLTYSFGSIIIDLT